MSTLLGILGRGIDTSLVDVIWHWLNRYVSSDAPASTERPALLRQAVALMGEMALDRAQRQLRLHLFENPQCIAGRLAASALCIHKDRLKEAIDELNSVYMQQPHNTLALHCLGYCYERLGNEAQAVEFYQDCLKFNDALELPTQRLAAIYLKNGCLDKAVQQYEPFRQQHPEDIRTLTTLGHLYTAAGRYTEAIDAFNTAIVVHPDNFLTHDDHLDGLMHQGDLSEALEYVQALLDEQPDREDLVIRRGDLLSMTGDVADAISQYRHAARLCPDSLEATIKLGAQYLKMQADQLAAQQFNHAVDINDRIVDAYLGLAAAQNLARRPHEARTTLSLACAIHPNSTFLFAETAGIVFRAATAACHPSSQSSRPSDIQAAVIEAHQDHLRDRPCNPELHYCLGLLLMNAGNLSQAADCFKAAVDIHPHYAKAASALAIALSQTGRLDDALAQLTPDKPTSDTFQLYYQTALLYCNRVKFASSMLNLQHHLERTQSPALDAASNISVVLQNLGLADTVSLMWENLAETAARSGSVAGVENAS